MTEITLTVRTERLDEIVAALNRLAAMLIPATIAQRAACVREDDDAWLRRRGLGDLVDDNPIPAPETQAPADPVAGLAPVEAEGEPPVLPETRWTPDRNELLQRLYPVETSLDAVLARLNELPGPTVSKSQMKTRAIQIYHLRRPAPAAPGAPKPVAPTAAPVAPRPPPVAPALVKRAPAGKLEPVLATYETVANWAGQRGLATTRARLDLPAVNAKRVDLGLPPFALAGRG